MHKQTDLGSPLTSTSTLLTSSLVFSFCFSSFFLSHFLLVCFIHFSSFLLVFFHVLSFSSFSSSSNHPNFRKNALGAKRPFSELWEQCESHNSRSNSRSDSRSWSEPTKERFSFAPVFSKLFFSRMGWTPRARPHSPWTWANNCNLLTKMGISLRPRLHRPRSELPNSRGLFVASGTRTRQPTVGCSWAHSPHTSPSAPSPPSLGNTQMVKCSFPPPEVWNSEHHNRTIAIASDFRVDRAKSPEILQKQGVLGSEIAARNRKSLATFHRTLKSQCSIAFSIVSEIAAMSGIRDGHRNRKSQKIAAISVR